MLRRLIAAAAAALLALPCGAEPSAAPPLASGPDLSVRVRVRDTGHLAALVRTDPDLRRRARRLERRRRAAIAAGFAGFGTSLALTAAGFVRMSNASARAEASPTYTSTRNDGVGLVIGGLAVCAVTPVVLWAVMPKRHELADVVEGWNGRYPGEPVELGGGGHW